MTSHDRAPVNRRKFITAAAAGGLATAVPRAASAYVPVASHGTSTYADILGIAEQGPRLHDLTGTLSIVMAGGVLRAVCGVRGLRATHAITEGENIRLSVREIDFFVDRDTGQPLQHLVNPCSGETVLVEHTHVSGETTVRSRCPDLTCGGTATLRHEFMLDLSPLDSERSARSSSQLTEMLRLCRSASDIDPLAECRTTGDLTRVGRCVDWLGIEDGYGHCLINCAIWGGISVKDWPTALLSTSTRQFLELI